MIQKLIPRNFLSFGPEHPGIDLLPLNILIGPNGSGKSNLIEAIHFMRSSPKDLRDVTRKGGGVSEWIWKGKPDHPASVEIQAALPGVAKPVRHLVAFQPTNQSFELVDERVEEIEPRHAHHDDVYFYYRYQSGNPTLLTASEGRRNLQRQSIEPDRSILPQRRDPETFPELNWLARSYESIRLYREWAFGRNPVLREPQKADTRNDRLEEDFSNLGLFLNRIKSKFPAAKRVMIDALRDLYDGITDFDILVEGGTVQIFFTEGNFSIPATRLSDGTLRYLCLLAILCDPEPPPLLAIEEPELGLHPDILPPLARLLRSCSERTQLIVTTHSDTLLDCFTGDPDSVVVCNRAEHQTSMERLDSTQLTTWLENYKLGQLWLKGEIGGTRW